MHKALEIGQVGAAPSFVFDERGYPCCVWISGHSVNHSLFDGSRWNTLGDENSIATSTEPLRLSKNCVAVGRDRAVHVVYLAGSTLNYLYWDGSLWQQEVVAYDQPAGLRDWSLVLGPDPFLTTLVDNYVSCTVNMYRRVAGAWQLVASESVFPSSPTVLATSLPRALKDVSRCFGGLSCRGKHG